MVPSLFVRAQFSQMHLCGVVVVILFMNSRCKILQKFPQMWADILLNIAMQFEVLGCKFKGQWLPSFTLQCLQRHACDCTSTHVFEA